MVIFGCLVSTLLSFPLGMYRIEGAVELFIQQKGKQPHNPIRVCSACFWVFAVPWGSVCVCVWYVYTSYFVHVAFTLLQCFLINPPSGSVLLLFFKWEHWFRELEWFFSLKDLQQVSEKISLYQCPFGKVAITDPSPGGEAKGVNTCRTLGMMPGTERASVVGTAAHGWFY